MTKALRPDSVPSITIRLPIGCTSTKMYITLSQQEGKLLEVFGLLGKAGGCVKIQVEAITRVISVGLRSGIPAEEFIKQLEGLACPEPTTHQGTTVTSCADAISKAMEIALKEFSND